VRWSLGSLAPGARRSLRLRLRADAQGEVTLQATATADRRLLARGELTTLFRGAGGLTFLTEPEENPVYVNTPTSCTITVLNTGTAAAKDVRIKATVPNRMRITQVQAPSGVKFTQDKQVITFEPLANLPAQSEVSYRILVTPIEADNDARFLVEMTAAEPKLDRPVQKTTPLTIASPESPPPPESRGP
jgi:hypothetical protein